MSGSAPPTPRVLDAAAAIRRAGGGRLVFFRHPRTGIAADLPGGRRLWSLTVEEATYLLLVWFRAKVRRAMAAGEGDRQSAPREVSEHP